MMFPSTACLIQHKIGAHRAWGFDLSAACSAFTYSLTTASQMVATGAHDHALVVGADVMSSIIDYTDRSTCVLFGDGAGAVRRLGGALATRARSSTSSTKSTAAAGPALLHAGRRQPHSRRRTRPIDQRLHYVKQDGQTVFKFAVRKTEEISRRVLERNGLTPARPRSVRVASGQPPHHPVRRPRSSARPGESDHQHRAVRQHDGGDDSAGAERRGLLRSVEEGRPRAAGIRRRAPGFTVGAVLLRWGF